MLIYQDGDATAPFGEQPRIIAHICNDIGGWGAGFVLAISKRWPAPEQKYRAWATGALGDGDVPFRLGMVQLVRVEPNLWVANMVAQHGVGVQDGVPPIRYEALAECLDKLAARALRLGAAVHMPRIGCGLAGGRWEEIGPLVERALVDRGVPVTVYDFVPTPAERTERERRGVTPPRPRRA